MKSFIDISQEFHQDFMNVAFLFEIFKTPVLQKTFP